MSDRRVSINDIKVPTEVVKFLSLERLKALQDEESSFNEFFGSLDLDDVSAPYRGWSGPFTRGRSVFG